MAETARQPLPCRNGVLFSAQVAERFSRALPCKAYFRHETELYLHTNCLPGVRLSEHGIFQNP
jgi:hypothetical protein